MLVCVCDGQTTTIMFAPTLTLDTKTKQTPGRLPWQTEEWRQGEMKRRERDRRLQREKQWQRLKAEVTKYAVAPVSFTPAWIRVDKSLAHQYVQIAQHLSRARNVHTTTGKALHLLQALEALAGFVSSRTKQLAALREEQTLVVDYRRQLAETARVLVDAGYLERASLLEQWTQKDEAADALLQQRITRLETVYATPNLFATLRGRPWAPASSGQPRHTVLRLSPMTRPPAQVTHERWLALEEMDLTEFQAGDEFTTMWGDVPENGDVLVIGLTYHYVVFARQRAAPSGAAAQAEDQDEFDFQWPNFLRLRSVLLYDPEEVDRKRGDDKPYADEADDLFVVPIKKRRDPATGLVSFVGREWGSRASDDTLLEAATRFLRDMLNDEVDESDFEDANFSDDAGDDAINEEEEEEEEKELDETEKADIEDFIGEESGEEI